MPIKIIIGVLIVGMYVTINVQNRINDNLNLELSSVRTELTDFKKSVETDIKGLKQLDADRKQERDQQKKNEQKFRKDSDRKNVVAAKPKLVEKQINNSFNKLSDDFTEMTK